jgi:hypothetical protein
MTRGRPLTENERVVLARLLSGEFPGADAFRAQIAATSVTGVCGCGCSSLTLAVDHTKANPAPDQGPDWDMIVENGGSTSWLVVHQKGGWLAELEHVPDHGLGPGSVDPSEVFPNRGSRSIGSRPASAPRQEQYRAGRRGATATRRRQKPMPPLGGVLLDRR